MKNYLAVIILIMTILSGCTNRAYRDFDIRFENNYGKEIKRIEMKSMSGAYVFRELLAPGGSRIIGLGLTYPANDIYEIEWQYSDKEKYFKRFDLRNVLPENFKGDIVFSVTENNELVFYQWISPYQYDYSIELLNDSGSIIYEPSIMSSNEKLYINIKYRRKIPIGKKIIISGPRKFSAKGSYRIAWSIDKGKKYIKEVDLRNVIDDDFEGAIKFTINKENDVDYSYW